MDSTADAKFILDLDAHGENGFFRLAAAGETAEYKRVYEGARKGAVKSGYGYEYLQKIASITGWNYGYVSGTRTELLEKLRKGEIDVLAGIGEQDVMAEDEAGFFLPDYPMVRENYYFYVSNKENLSTQDLHALDGRRIGAPEGEAANLTRAWLNEHGIEAVVVEYSNSLQYYRKAPANWWWRRHCPHALTQ